VDEPISKRSRAFLLLAIRIVENPPVVFVLFFAVLYPMLIISLIVHLPPASLLVEVIAAGFATFYTWAIANGTATTWEGVVVSAERVRNVRSRKEAVKTHFEIVLRFLRSSLNELEVDVLAVRSQHGLGSGSEETKRYSAQIAVQALTLNLFEKLIYFPEAEQNAALDAYCVEIHKALERIPTHEGAIVDFVARQYDALDNRLRRRANSWRPPPSFLELVEKHPATAALIVALSAIGIAAVAAVLFKVSIPISP
jgi:hypothetical protein